MNISTRERGLTLIELAVALVIVAMLLGSILVPLTRQVENRKVDETQRLLEQAREALLGYVAARGYFPCPATATTNGAEPNATTDTPAGPTDHNTGVCGTYYGFLPAVQLGFTPVDSQGFAVDGWGQTQNRIRYAIASQTSGGITLPFTRSGGMVAATISNLGQGDYLYICASASGVTANDCGTTASNRITSTAVAVIWSLGPNAATGGTSLNEAENLDSDRIFVSRVRSDITGSVFDDMVTWIPVTTLISRQISAGQLP